jgi:hypothetical protein
MDKDIKDENEERIRELEERLADIIIWAKGTNMNFEHWYKGKKEE